MPMKWQYYKSWQTSLPIEPPRRNGFGSGSMIGECQGSGFRNQVSGFRVQVSGFRVQGSGFRVQGSGLRVQGSGFRAQGPGFRV